MKRLAHLRLLPVTGLVYAGRAVSWRNASKRRSALTAMICAMVGLYAASPFIALWSISDALRAHDEAALSTHIDWSSLSASLKQQTIDRLMGPPPADDDLPDFGTAFAASAVSHAIDTRLTPNALINMAARLMPQDGQPLSWTATIHRASVWFEAPNRFRAQIYSPQGDTEAIVHLRFEHWRWQITQVDIPHNA